MNSALPIARLSSLRPLAAGIACVLAIGAPDFTEVALAAAPDRPLNVITVGNCNDSGVGSLRDAIASAADEDEIDLSQLECSTITLTSGEIEIPQDDLYLKYSGEGGTPPTIDGNSSGRVFNHTGQGTLKIVGLTITHGKYDDTNIPNPTRAQGGCIFSNGSVYLAGSTVTGCEARDTHGATTFGGGVAVAQTLTLLHSVVSENTATSTIEVASGGGALAKGVVNIYYSSVSGNIASGPGDFNSGGGIEVGNIGALSTIANSTIEGNVADRGGGLFIFSTGNGGALLIENSTISGNTANGYAAAAYLIGHIRVINSTIAFNQSPNLGPAVELASTASPIEFQSSILSNNNGGGQDYDVGDRGEPLTIAGANNLVGFANASILLPPDTLVADPLLLPLADNGGPTRTHALGDGSPAIDAGNNVAGLAVDQRGNGYPRVAGAAADIGAYESASDGDTVFASGFDF